ncbi:unnamed protein product [Caenorhabditis angaria]|uniref:Uncharacterized protein n=1 Tax=Caenorhabditis angaria TaxID=860376 RepID=A0A9P1IE39_9PELO|nr:unnamed protein product [Caenorhabditis angaria]
MLWLLFELRMEFQPVAIRLEWPTPKISGISLFFSSQSSSDSRHANINAKKSGKSSNLTCEHCLLPKILLNKKQFMEKLRKGEIKMFELPEDENKMMKCDMRLLAYRDVDGKLRYRYNLSENQKVKAGSQMDSLEQSVLN